MSMLSAQCDELRAMAESVGLAVPQAATLMMGAADTIWDLRNKCADLVGERERLFRANVEKNNEMLRLARDNGKLRELAQDMGELLDVLTECDMACKHYHDGCIGDCYYVNARRELGVEVKP